MAWSYFEKKKKRSIILFSSCEEYGGYNIQEWSVKSDNSEAPCIPNTLFSVAVYMCFYGSHFAHRMAVVLAVERQDHLAKILQ